MGVVGELRLISDVDMIYCQFGQGEWKVMVRYGENQWVLPLAPTARGRTTLEGYLTKIKNLDIGVLEIQDDFEGDFEVRKVSKIETSMGRMGELVKSGTRLGK